MATDPDLSGGAPAAAPLRVPLHNRAGEIVAHALISPEDAHLAAFRWHRNAHGYAVRLVTVDERRPSGKKRQRAVFLHREVLGLAFGDRLQSDHISRDRLDCRRENLRVVTHAQSMQNRRGWGRSQARGVAQKADGRWAAYIYLPFEGRSCKLHLGTFDVEDAAAAASARARQQYMPFATD
jgi:hypothetical protein